MMARNCDDFVAPCTPCTPLHWVITSNLTIEAAMFKLASSEFRRTVRVLDSRPIAAENEKARMNQAFFVWLGD